jgi:glycosyltransferase involved in cell wall biosynthesis
MRILHILDRLSGAGPTRSTIGLAKYQARLGLPYEHRIVTLQRDAYPFALILATQAGMRVLRQPDREALEYEIAAADVVQVCFWNNPPFYAFLRNGWPAMRLVFWFMMAGDRAPQVITPQLVETAGFCVATTPHSLTLPVLQTAVQAGRTGMVYGIADFDRLAGLEPRPHDTFNVGYIGTVNFSKMHARYLPMSLHVNLPGVRFVVCGGGIEVQLKQQAVQLGGADRFVFRGFVENIKSELETFDLFGYPLCEDTYATSEICLQEAMFAGVPPVVFPYGGIRYLVEDGQTGLVVHSEEEYARAIEHLYHSPAERQRLGRNAREYAREHYAAEVAARQFDDIYQRVIQFPKREHRWLGQAAAAAAANRFVEAMGDAAPQFASSLHGPDAEAEEQIAASSPLLATGEGGIFHYRNAYPDDPTLRLWSALVLQRRGQSERAGRELQAAIDLGLDPGRVGIYLERLNATVQDV